jgi:hypothetical protein
MMAGKVAVACGAWLPGAGRSQALSPTITRIDKSNKIVRLTSSLL